MPPSAQQSPPSGAVSIPDHVLLRRIGKGSYGEVWLARNSMGAYRAVKIVRRASFEESRPFERELSGIRAFEPISRSHEGFIDILHVGIEEEKGLFYYVMELGDDHLSGQTINPQTYFPKTLFGEIKRSGRLSPRECLELGLALSLALAELHKRELVHRDIKPSNIIFVNGVAKLADIGLVAETKQPSSFVGTEGFMPPEGPGTPQADVYSLGKVLYEASTGKDRMCFPELPTVLFTAPEHEALVEFNEVIARACDARPARRYQNAWEMHAELVVLANGKSVRRLRKLELWLSRLKRGVALAALSCVVLGVLGFEIDREWRSAIETREREVGASLAYGNRSMEAGDLLGALPYYARALELERGGRNAELPYRLRVGSTLAQCPKLVQIWTLSKEVDSVSFDSSGSRVLAAEWAGRAQVFDVASGQALTRPFGQLAGLRRGVFSPDGGMVATASEDGTVCVWKAANGARLLILKHANKAVCARFSPNGDRIVTACDDGIARIWNVRTGALESKLKGHSAPLLFAAFSEDGKRVVTTGRDHTARIWDATTGLAVCSPLVHPRWVEYADFSLDGTLLITACDDHEARVWDIKRGVTILPNLDHPDVVRSAQFSPDGRLILTACLDGTVRLWLAKNHQPLNPNPILRLPDRVTDAVFGPDGHRILASCTDGSVWMWDLAGSAVAPNAMHNWFSQDDSRYVVETNGGLEVLDTSSRSPVSYLPSLGNSSAVRLNQNGRFVVTSLSPTGARPRAAVEVWDVQTGKREGPPLALTNSTDQLLLSNDGRTLVAFAGKIASTWDVPDGVPLARMVHDENITSVALNPAGTAVASWSGGTVKVWKSSTGRELFPALKHPFPVTHVEFSPDGSRLVTCGADTGFTKCYAQIWDAATGRPVCPPLYHRDGVLWAAFSPDGTRVVTGGEDFVARVWDASTGRPITPPLKHSSVVLRAAFSPDGKWVVTASPDKTVRVWSAETGDPLTPPLWHQTKVVDARFLADGRQIVTWDKEGDHRIWKLPLDKRSVPDLLRLANLLSDEGFGSGTPSLRSGQSLQSLWLQLRAKYPAQFRVSSGELAAWYDCQARQCERDHDWFAAQFHLKRLLSLRPSDLSVADRLTVAERRLSHNP